MPPDYFDLQVNGYAGVDFNKDDLTADELHLACGRLRADGYGGILATVITEDVPRMALRLANLVRHRERDPLAREMIAGFHVEGPFLNETPGYRGAHPADAMHPADLDEMKRLLDAAGGLARVVTLAPERDPSLRVTRMLSDAGVVVSAGHCDPPLDTLEAAIDAGLQMFTHLGNGCPMLMNRHDNVVQRVLSLADRLWVCFIADGAHVPFFALRNYLRAAGMDRAIVVSDAVAPAGLGPGRYTLGRWELLIGDDLVARAPDGSHLIGSAVTMTRQADNLRAHVGLTDAQVRQLTADNPRRAIGSA
ncbi:MAG: N-acetylglucosamine-6-phosphate deacetylase [uncultured Phycisphaerae bacterium]|uniref:N-acetylglucosamine-6-phosphate deacetylase n=1 Tax=uncultured Phycisphaerae bacterium TaxID=904963 RepID=A0A6J4QM38_9BACT|nr:MAG: N-acetylglucosamine-6-phosphate deacetylase [uncultured Phycisphaerae bacterium]